MQIKFLPLLTALVLVLGVTTTGLHAQSWDQLGPLLELFNEDQRNDFEEDLDDLRIDFLFTPGDGISLADIELSPAQDSLFSYLNGGGIGLPDSFINVWLANNETLENIVGTGIFTPGDSLGLLELFGDVEGVWFDEVDSLGTIINTIGADGLDINQDLFTEGDGRFDANVGPTGFSFNRLVTESRNFRNGIPPSDELDGVVDALDATFFAGNMDIEMAFGQEWADVVYYGESYSARSSLIRIASVPTYDETLSYRWSAEGSFFTVSDDITDSNGANLEGGLNPFICNVNAAMTFMPSFGDIEGAEFRLYTSVGFDLSTYVPAHVDPSNPSTMDNIGFTTGFGPEVGAGFVINTGPLSLYSYGTIATGEVFQGPADYNYMAFTANAGVRIGDVANIRYTLGDASWAPDGNKTARYSRFTVGIILDSLNRN